MATKAQTVAAASTHSAATSSHAASHTTQSHSHATTNSHAVKAQSHGHDSHHAAPWEGVNLWRTPYKGDTDTITHVKRNKGTLDKYVEDRTRRIQQLQLLALVNIV